jgi:virulence-associated protein VagC
LGEGVEKMNDERPDSRQSQQEPYVFVKKSGNIVMLIPAKNSWDTLVQSLAKFSDDFMAERKQPKAQKRWK